MNQRGKMPAHMKGFVTFMGIGFVSVFALTMAGDAHVIHGRTWMACFITAGVIAGLSGYFVWRSGRTSA